MYRSFLVVTSFVVAIATATAVFAAPAPSPFPVGRETIVDPAVGAMYVAKPNGTIDAVDLASGRTLWTSADAALPIGLDSNLLVAQVENNSGPANGLPIAVLDAASGRKLSTAVIPLPSGVLASINVSLNATFQAVADREGTLFLVSWVCQQRSAKGAIDDDDESSPALLYGGSARISPETGNVISPSGGLVTGVPGRWHSYGLLPAPPWQSHGVSARTEGGRGGPVTLKRNDGTSGHALPDVALSAHAVLAFSSADQANVQVNERVGQGTLGNPEYRWLIFATDTGKQVGELRNDLSSSPFFVFGDSIVFKSPRRQYLVNGVRVDEPLQLNALRVSTGVPLWNVEIRDLIHGGPGVAARKRSQR